MSKRCLVFAVAIILATGTSAVRAAEPVVGAAAETNLHVLLDTIRSNRKALVAVNLGLTDDEAAKFWPIYDRYQNEMNAIGNRVVRVIEEYTANFNTLSDDKALRITGDYLDIEGDRVKVRRTYVDQFAQALPGRKLARFYQIENKMDAVIRYDLAATIPVIEAGGGPSAK